jgi:hypothetical protein
MSKKAKKFTVRDFKVYSTNGVHILFRFPAERLLEVGFLDTNNSEPIASDSISLSILDFLLFFLDRIFLTLIGLVEVEVILVVVDKIANISLFLVLFLSLRLLFLFGLIQVLQDTLSYFLP